MDVREALMGRRTVHKYRPAHLPEGALQRALEAAMMAPNHRLTHPWRFYHVGPQTRLRLVEDTQRAQALKQGQALSAEQAAKVASSLLDASELVAFCQLRSDDSFRAREDYATLACAIQNFCLSLWGEGIGSKWSTGQVSRHPDTYTALGVDPAREEIVGFVWVGVPEGAVEKAPPRPSLSAVLTTLP